MGLPLTAAAPWRGNEHWCPWPGLEKNTSKCDPPLTLKEVFEMSNEKKLVQICKGGFSGRKKKTFKESWPDLPVVNKTVDCICMRHRTNWQLTNPTLNWFYKTWLHRTWLTQTNVVECAHVLNNLGKLSNFCLRILLSQLSQVSTR